MHLFINSTSTDDVVKKIEGSPVNHRSIPQSVVTLNSVEVRSGKFNHVRYASKNLLDLERWDLLALCGWYRCEVVSPLIGADKVLGDYSFVFDAESLVITATNKIINKELGAVKKEAVTLVRDNRGFTLDRFTLNHPGVQMIYGANILAVERYRAGSVIPVFGKSPVEHLTSLAQAQNVDIDVFASYVETESARIGPSAHEVERRYIEAIYYIGRTGDDAHTAEEMAVKAQEFGSYCKTVETE